MGVFFLAGETYMQTYGVGVKTVETFPNLRYIFKCPNPIGSMYGIFTYIWLIFKVNIDIPYMDAMGNDLFREWWLMMPW